MPFDIGMERRDGYLFVTAKGDVRRETILQLGEEIRVECGKADIHRVLVDCGQMRGALTAAELATVTAEFIRTIGPATKVAYVNPPPEWNPEEDQFSRDVARKRGGSLELFASEAEAVAWLKQS